MAEETITILRVDGGSAITTIKELREYIRQLKNELSTLTVGTEDYQSKLGTLITAQNALRGAMNATSASMEDVATAAAGTGKSYNSLVNQMANLRRAQRSLNIETDEGKKQYAEMAVQINSLNDELKALDAQNGNYQRNVGNYQSAFNGLNMATAQIVRELPSASVSLNTFFLAISNNIPMLVDQINLLREQNKNLIAEGKQGINVLSTVARSFLSWNTVLTLVITAVTLFGDKIADWIGDLFRGKDAIDANAEALENYNKAMNEASKAESEATVTSRLLYNVATDTARSMDERLSAVRQLKNEYPEYLGNLDDEVILTGNAEEAYNRLNDALTANARTRAYLNAITEQQASIVDVELKRAEAQERLAQAQEALARSEASYQNAVNSAGGSGMAALSQDVQFFSQQAARFQDEINDITDEIAGYDAQIAAVTGTIEKLSRNVNVDFITGSSGAGSNSLMKELQQEMQSWNIEIPVTPVIDTDDGLLDSLEDEDRQREFRQRRNDLQLENLQKQADQAQAWNQVMIGADEERAERSYNIEQEYYQKRLELLERFHQEAMDNGDMESALSYEQEITDARSQIWLSYFTRLDELRQEDLKKQDKAAKESEKIEQLKQRAIIGSVNAIGSVLGSVADMYEASAGDSEEAARQVKNIRIAEATINTISGAISAYMTAQQLGFPWGTIIGAAQFATVLAAGMAQIAKIRNTEINKDSAPSGSTSGISASVSAPAVTPQVSNVRNVTSASEEERLNQMASSQKVYILSSDIEASQRQRKVQVQESSF